MRTFVEKLAKAIKERGIANTHLIHIDGFRIMTYGIREDKFLELTNPDNIRGNLKIYDDEYDLLKRVITDCQQRTEDVLIDQLNNL